MLLGLIMRVFPERLNGRETAHLEYEKDHPIDWGLRVSQM
ncbi:rCG52040, partial [Rattus norvegicus]